MVSTSPRCQSCRNNGSSASLARILGFINQILPRSIVTHVTRGSPFDDGAFSHSVLSAKLFTSLLCLKITARNVINQTFATSWFLPYLAKLRVCREGVPGRGTGFFSVQDRGPRVCTYIPWTE